MAVYTPTLCRCRRASASTTGSALSLLFCADMPSPATPGVRLAIPVKREQRGLHDVRTHSAQPIPPPSASGGTLLSGLSRFAFATACLLARLPGGSTRGFPRIRRLLLPCLSTRRSPGSTMGMTPSVSGHLRWRDCPARRATERRCTLTNRVSKR